MATIASAIAIGGVIFTSRLKSDVAKTSLALLAEKEKRRKSEAELVESRERKLQMEEDQYFQQIVAADQAFEAKDPTHGPAAVGRLPARASELGMASLEPATPFRAADDPGTFGIRLPRLPARHSETSNVASTH